MKLLLVLILLLSVALTGCASVKTYTFKKDRVDQRIEGNRGFVMGTPPLAPIVRETPKRTLIGIDMELDILPGEEVTATEVAPVKEAIIEPTIYEQEEEMPTPSAEEEEIEEEEEWIK